jgi:outer membrane murein-binding lipoprotein Lpp
MTTPIDPKQSTRLSQISFFHICNWITTHMAEVTPGKTHAELTQLINETEELTEHTPSGGLGIHSIPAIIRATGYTPAAPGVRSKSERTKITKTHFNELKREVARIKQDVESIRAQIQARVDTVVESQHRVITTLQEVRDNITGDKRDWAILDEEIPFEDETEDEKILFTKGEAIISPEDEPRSTDGDPAMREHAEVDKVRDDNDTQLDDTYPEDAPHQEEYKETQEKGAFEADLSDVSFKGFQPSAEIQKIIDEGNESARKQAEANKEEQTTSFPE